MLGSPTTALLLVLAAPVVVSSLVWLLILQSSVRRAYRRGYDAGQADQLRAGSAQLGRVARLQRHFYPPVNND